MNQGTNLGSQIGRWIILAAVVALLGALLLTIRPVGAQSSAPIDVSYPENSTGRVGSPVYAQDPERRGVNWKVEGTDFDLFEINTNNNAGTLSFKDSPDFEDPKDGDENNLYVVIVRAVDPGGRVSAARTFNVAVTNVEEKGEVIVSHNGDEPWYGGLQPRVGVELFAYATDPDHIQDDVDTTADDVTWQWYRGDESSAVCGDSVSDNCLIEGADESAYTPSTGDVGKSLTVAASYFDKENITSRKAAASESMYVTQAAGANKLPTFEQDQTAQTEDDSYGSEINTLIDLMPFVTDDDTTGEVVQLEIREDASIGDMVGPDPIAATDPDEGDKLTYSIEDGPTGAVDHAEFFAIDRATGQITLKKKVDADLVTDPHCGTAGECLVTVTATDSSGIPADGDDPGTDPDHVQINLQIAIIGVNELPEIDGDNAVSVDENLTDIDADGETTDAAENYMATDVDNVADELSWSLSGTDADFFRFGTGGDITVTATGAEGDLQFKEAPDFEDPKDANKDNTYEVTLNVSDGTGTTTLEVKVTVKNLVIIPTGLPNEGDQEEAGVIALSHIQPRVGVPFVATLKDDDGGVRSESWQWYRGDYSIATLPTVVCSSGTVDLCRIDGATSKTYEPTANDATKTLTAVVTYLDATSKDQTQTRTARGASETTVGAALDPNRAPTFAEDRYAREVVENATAVTNPDPDSTDAFIPAMDEDTPAPGEDMVQFSLSGADSEYFNVTNETNLEAVIVPKSGLNYESPKDADRNNIYVFTLTVTDSSGRTDTATVSVTVTDFTEPLVAPDDVDGMTVEENSPLRTNIGKPIEPSDPGDSTYQTYELLDGTDADATGNSAYFRIHRDDGQIYVNDELDYEAAPCGTDSACSVMVTITGWKTDDEDANESVQVGQSTTNEFDIMISDVNETPSYAGTQTRYVAENAWKLEGEEPNEVLVRDTKTGKPATLGSTLVLVTDDGTPGLDMDRYRTTVTATGDPVAADDPDEPSIPTLRDNPMERVLYTMSGPDAMYFGIYRGTGQIILQEILDFESLPASKKYFNVKVTATDRAGLSDTTDVTINVVDVNEPPVHVIGLSVLGQSGWNYDENGTDAVGTYEADGTNAENARWSVGGADGSLFMVAPTSGMSTMLRFRSSPNFEAPTDADGDNVYMVTIQVSQGADDTATMDVAITVDNVEEPGAVTLAPMRPSVGTEITATLEDDDIVSSESWQWASSTAMDGTFTNISGATDASYEPVAAVAGLWLRASVTYTDAIDRGNVAMMVTEGAVTEVPVNVAPEFADETATRSIAENTAPGRNIGAPVVAIDPNDDILTYTLERTDATSFRIDGSTGQLRTFAALDFETKSTYSVEVTATDPGGLSDTIDVTINVTDVDEVVPPVVETYDTNDDGDISIAELFVAIDDYFDGGISIAELFQVIDAYFE